MSILIKFTFNSEMGTGWSKEDKQRNDRDVACEPISFLWPPAIIN